MRLLRGNPLGIEITDTHVKLCEARKKGGKTQVKHYASVELPNGTMNDGRLMDELALAQACREALNLRPWSTGDVRFAIPSQTVMVRFLKMPNVGTKALRKIVDFEIKHNIHLPFDDPFYDFVKLETKESPAPAIKSDAKLFQHQWEAAAAKEPSGSNPFAAPPADSEDIAVNTCDVMLVAASMESLRQYTRLFEDLGLKLSSIEIKAFSLNRLQQLSSPKQELLLLADVGAANCDLTIVQDGVIRITRNVPLSFTAQKEQPADALDRLFADFIPQTVSYDGSFGDLSGEIERLINFYRYTLNHREAVFDRLVVTGDITMMDELIAYLGNRMSLTVATAAAPSIDVAGSRSEWDLPTYAVPLGLCLRRGK
ncbi:type IV pilus biogenesis protein PilM [Cohnella sp. GCM10027633]|uniref:type IV pilus biogenesis protein PilM n=1 Tax=unclassified Cohnella TaxID=2636738 RepID=UPI003642F796